MQECGAKGRRRKREWNEGPLLKVTVLRLYVQLRYVICHTSKLVSQRREEL